MRADEMLGIDEPETIDQHVAEMLGADYEDLDFYGKSLFRRIAARIRKRIRARRAKRRAKTRGAPEEYAVQTPGGRLSYSEQQGLSFLRPAPGTAASPYAAPVTVQRAGFMEMIQKNPLLLAIPAGVLLVLAMRAKQTKTTATTK